MAYEDTNRSELMIPTSDGIKKTYVETSADQVVMKSGRKLEEALSDMYVNVKDFGAKGDGTTDDTLILQSVFNSFKKVLIPDGDYRITAPLIISQDDCEIMFSKNARIFLDNGVFTDRLLSVTGSRNKVTLGKCETLLRKKFVVAITGNDNIISGGQVFFVRKSTMSPDPTTSIIYNQGGIELRGHRNIVKEVETFNHEGAGVYIYDESNKVINSYIHDNCTGVITLGSKDIAIIDNIIENNNVNNKEAFDGILANTDGLTIKGNLITGSGEHGTYVRGSNIVISGNTVRDSYYNGIKVRDVRACIISENALDGNNASLVVGQSQIYAQSTFENIAVSNNIETNPLADHFISAVSSNTTESGVIVTGNVAMANIIVHASKDVIISQNRTQKAIWLGFPDSTYPNILNAVVSSNNAKEIRLSRAVSPLVEGNSIERITGSGDISAIIRGNVITKQDVGLDIRVPREFSNNNITCTMTTGSFLLQHTAKRSDKTFKNNRYSSSGAKFLSFSSEAISSDNLVFVGNEFSGATQTLYFWGEKHLIEGNRANEIMGYLGCNNSIITNNFNPPIMRANLVGNIITNNI